MDAVTIGTSIIGSTIVATTITQFTKAHISSDSRVRTIWAIIVSAGVGLVGALVAGFISWLAGDEITWSALLSAIGVQLPSVVSSAYVFYSVVRVLVPGAKDVDIDTAVAAVKDLVATAEQVTSEES